MKIDSVSRTIFSASDDLTIRLWDIDTRKCLRVLKGHVGQVQQIVPLVGEFELDDRERENHADDSASETSSGEVSSPEMIDFASVAADSCYNDAFNSGADRNSPPRYVLTSALDSTIRLWDVPTDASRLSSAMSKVYGQSLPTHFAWFPGQKIVW